MSSNDSVDISQKSMTTNTKKRFEYKWIILVVCFLMVFVCLGF